MGLVAAIVSLLLPLAVQASRGLKRKTHFPTDNGEKNPHNSGVNVLLRQPNFDGKVVFDAVVRTYELVGLRDFCEENTAVQEQRAPSKDFVSKLTLLFSEEPKVMSDDDTEGQDDGHNSNGNDVAPANENPDSVGERANVSAAIGPDQMDNDAIGLIPCISLDHCDDPGLPGKPLGNSHDDRSNGSNKSVTAGYKDILQELRNGDFDSAFAVLKQRPSLKLNYKCIKALINHTSFSGKRFKFAEEALNDGFLDPNLTSPKKEHILFTLVGHERNCNDIVKAFLADRRCNLNVCNGNGHSLKVVAQRNSKLPIRPKSALVEALRSKARSLRRLDEYIPVPEENG